MGSKKRKRGCGGERRSIHPRNRYADNPPDFSLLASLYPSFSSFVHYSPDGRPSIDWTDFNATRELTRTLLLHDYSLNWYCFLILFLLLICAQNFCFSVQVAINFMVWEFSTFNWCCFCFKVLIFWVFFKNWFFYFYLWISKMKKFIGTDLLV